MRLVGRASEQQVIDSLLDKAREGLSGVLVVRGESGIGKTALLQYAAEAAVDFEVLHAVAVESEMELGFATLDQLCRPIADRLDCLPERQATALRASLGLGWGESSDRFLVGLAVLTLLSDVAEQRPLLCLVDDVQWLDQASAQVLGFVARRLQAESVVLILAGRSHEPCIALGDLPGLSLGRLPDTEARQLLASALPGAFDRGVQDRIIAEAQGNPLALLELPAGSIPTDLAGGFGIPYSAASTQVQRRVEESFCRRIEQLPRDTQLLLLLAAAEPLGDPDLLRAAAKRLGLDPHAETPAEAAGLLRVRDRVAFRHPLVRSAVYGPAPEDDRRQVHRALAEVTNPETDPDRRAWHRAAAAVDPDEGVAAELERSAERAHARGGLAAAAAFLERATALTPDAGRRAVRAMAAARAKMMAGSTEAARQLASVAEAGPLEPLDRARLELVLAQTTIYPNYRPVAHRLLVSAAKRLAPLDAALSRETYLEAIQAAVFAGRLGEENGTRVTAEAALAAPPAPKPPRSVDLLLDGLATRLVEGGAAGIPTLQRALAAFRADQDVRWAWTAMRTAIDLGDDETWAVLANRQVEVARQTGTLAVLPMALIPLALLHIFTGRFDSAAVLIEEADTIASAIGAAPIPYARVHLAAWRGRLAETTALIANTVNDATARGEGLMLTTAAHASTIQHIALGDYEKALSAAVTASDDSQPMYSWWALPDVVEAAVRTNRPDIARTASERLSSMATASGTEWALGMDARTQALVCADHAEAARLYRQAIERLERTSIAVDLARAHLLYGEMLRRDRRRVEARQHLRTANEMFSSMGAEAFVDRVARELMATGERTGARAPETPSQLTPQQAQVARLASQGYTNSEIGARLFISPRTVEYHLRNVFMTLGITSRAHLANALEPPNRRGLAGTAGGQR